MKYHILDNISDRRNHHIVLNLTRNIVWKGVENDIEPSILDDDENRIVDFSTVCFCFYTKSIPINHENTSLPLKCREYFKRSLYDNTLNGRIILLFHIW